MNKLCRYIAALLLLTFPGYATETPQSALGGPYRQVNSTGIAPPVFYGQAVDFTGAFVDYTINVVVGPSEPTGTVSTLAENCPTCYITSTIANCTNSTCGSGAGRNHWKWTPPSGTFTGSFGSITPRDGNQHTVCFYQVSQSNPGAGDILAGAGCQPFRWDAANSNLLPDWTANISGPVAPLTPSQVAVFANTLDPYSLGSTGSTVCTVSGTALKADGVAGYFILQHGVPCANARLVTMTVGDGITNAAANTALGPTISALPSSIQSIALAWMRPSVVFGGTATSWAGSGSTGCINAGTQPCYGISAWVMMYGVTGGAEPTGQACVQKLSGLGWTSQLNPAFNSGSNSTPFNTYNVRYVSMLAAALCPTCTLSPNNNSSKTWVEDAPTMNAVIDAAVAAKGTNPTGIAQIAFTNNSGRQILAQSFPPSVAGTVLNSHITTSLLGSFAAQTSQNATSGTTTGNLLYANGSDVFTWPSISAVAGSGLWTNNTSFSFSFIGFGNGQTPATGALGGDSHAGIQGTPFVAGIGTAVEPCQSIDYKLLDPYLYEQYITAGFTIVEAAWKSFRYPWNTNMIGDPLAQPYSPASTPTTYIVHSLPAFWPAAVHEGFALFSRLFWLA